MSEQPVDQICFDFLGRLPIVVQAKEINVGRRPRLAFVLMSSLRSGTFVLCAVMAGGKGQRHGDTRYTERAEARHWAILLASKSILLA